MDAKTDMGTKFKYRLEGWKHNAKLVMVVPHNMAVGTVWPRYEEKLGRRVIMGYCATNWLNRTNGMCQVTEGFKTKADAIAHLLRVNQETITIARAASLLQNMGCGAVNSGQHT